MWLPLFRHYQVLAFAVQKSDLDLRKVFYSSIVLSGGTTLFKGNRASAHKVTLCICSLLGFGDRLLSEMKKLTPKDIKIKV